MIRMKLNRSNLGVKVEQVDLQVESLDEAKEWMKTQFKNWDIPEGLIDENVTFERLELLLEDHA